MENGIPLGVEAHEAPASGLTVPEEVGSAAHPPPPEMPHPPMYAPVLGDQPDDNRGNRGNRAIAGLALGIVSIPAAFIAICGVALGLLGIILSAFGMRSLDRRGLAMAGLALAIVGVLLGIANGVFGYFASMNHYLYGPYAP